MRRDVIIQNKLYKGNLFIEMLQALHSWGFVAVKSVTVNDRVNQS